MGYLQHCGYTRSLFPPMYFNTFVGQLIVPHLKREESSVDSRNDQADAYLAQLTTSFSSSVRCLSRSTWLCNTRNPASQLAGMLPRSFLNGRKSINRKDINKCVLRAIWNDDYDEYIPYSGSCMLKSIKITRSTHNVASGLILLRWINKISTV